MYRKRHLPAAVAAACLLLTAAACNGEPDAQNSTTPTTSPSPTSTPTKPRATAPTMPPAAQSGLTVTSAEAFSRFYVAALDYAAVTGDVRLVRQWQDKGCENCKSIADLYDKTYRAGGTIIGQLSTRIVQTTESRLVRKDGAVVVFKTLTGKVTLRPSATGSPSTLPGGPGLLDFTLKAKAGRWTVYWLEVSE